MQASEGAQFAGLINFSNGLYGGPQFAGLFNLATADVRGAQALQGFLILVLVKRKAPR